jgi:hypothetical protein
MSWPKIDGQCFPGNDTVCGRAMKNNALTNLLVGLVVLSVLATAGLAYIYVRSVQRLNQLQLQTAVINRNRTLVNSLASEALEYSKRNPAIDPVLQSVGLKPRPGVGAPQPAAKP